MARPGLSYTGGHLDRADGQRKDPDRVAAWLARPETRILPLWRDRNLIAGLGRNPPAALALCLTGDSARRIVDVASEITFLGLDGDGAVFAADLSALEEGEAAGLVDAGAFVDLRQVGPLMEIRDAALAAYARGMLHWHRTHRHCGRCGHLTETRDGGHMRLCGNPDCGRLAFPRTDPAVIMLVEGPPSAGAPPTCLLGRHRRLPPGVYSTLAGFVEPGESLEEAVAREIHEETGVRVDEVVYQASQPWPFPASIMLGFRARARTTAITIDEQELDDARWFTAREIRGFGEWGDEEARLRLPRKDSIARTLIETWVESVET